MLSQPDTIVEVGGTSQALTYGAEIELVSGHAGDASRANLLFGLVTSAAQVLDWMGLESEAFAACVAAFPKPDAFIDELLTHLDAQHRDPSLRPEVERDFPLFPERNHDVPISTDSNRKRFREWLDYSKVQGWGYRDSDSGVLLGRPMAQMGDRHRFSMFLGGLPGQQDPDSQRIVALSKAGLLELEICEAAKDPQSWVPHPGPMEKFLDRGALSWEANFDYLEIHSRPLRHFEEVERFIRASNGEGSENPEHFSGQLWVVAHSEGLRKEMHAGWVGFHRLLQADLLLRQLYSSSVEQAMEIFSHRWLAPVDDNLLYIDSAQRRPRGTPKGTLRILQNPFADAGTTYPSGLRRPQGRTLDYPHVATELRMPIQEKEERQYVLAALASRLATGAFDEFLINGNAMPLAALHKASMARAYASGWIKVATELEVLGPHDEEGAMPQLIGRVIAALFDASPERLAETLPPDRLNRALLLPFWHWHQLPCYENIDELRQVYGATLEFVRSILELPSTSSSEDALRSRKAIMGAYLLWVLGSGLHDIVHRCLAPGHPGRRVYPRDDCADGELR